jgi:hypothetical protein
MYPLLIKYGFVDWGESVLELSRIAQSEQAQRLAKLGELHAWTFGCCSYEV